MEHKHYVGAAHSFEVVTAKDPVAGEYVRPDVTILKTFFIDDTVNANDWQATGEGLKQDAAELPGVPLVLQEDLEHPKFSVQQFFDRGTIFDYEVDETNKKIIVYVRITDPKIVDRIKSGELEYVSPAVIPRGNESLSNINGVDVLSRTLPIHLAIVGNPAYGKEKAKMTHMCSGDGEQCYHRLKMMTANVDKIIKREHELLDQGIPEDEVHEIIKKEFGKVAHNTGIKSKLRMAEGIPQLEQIPFIKKMVASLQKTQSLINQIQQKSYYPIHNGQEGYWVASKDQDVFVARGQPITDALIDQCGCTKLAAEEKNQKGRWITVRGTHIFIPDGEDIDKVVKEHFKDKQEKTRKPENRFKPKDTPEKTDREIVDELSSIYPSLTKKRVEENLKLYKELKPKLEKTNQDLQASLKKDLPQGATITGRVKKPYSAIEKVGRKPKYKDISDLQDSVGVRAMYKDITSVKEAMKIIKANYIVVDEDDYITKPKDDGYRSYHAIIKDKETGVESELQLRTENENTYADWAHHIYKPETTKMRAFVKENQDLVTDYQLRMSDYIYDLDLGKKVKKPECPPKIKEIDLCLE
jgi:putative GTP pyrophosphokinase